MNNYVLKHEYKFDERGKAKNKLKLRNFEDCKDYLEDILQHAFDATYENGVVFFFQQ